MYEARSNVYNVIVCGYSIGMTRSLAEAQDWLKRALHADKRIVNTGSVPFYKETKDALGR